MNRLSKSIVSNTTPSSLLKWLSDELDERAIPTVYARYILSILQADIEPNEYVNNRYYRLQRGYVQKNSFQFAKAKHQKYKKSGEKMVFLPPCGIQSNQSIKDGDRLKRNAAIDCLQPFWNDVDDIDELIDEVFIKIKNLRNQKACEKDKVYRSACETIENSYFRPASSSLDDIQKYFQDFPCLSSSFEDVTVLSPNTSIWDRKLVDKNFCNINKAIHSISCVQSVKNSNQPVIPYDELKTIRNVYKADSPLILNPEKALVQSSEIDIDYLILNWKKFQNANTLKLLNDMFIVMQLTKGEIKQGLKLPVWTCLSLFNNINLNGPTVTLKPCEMIQCSVLIVSQEIENKVYLNYLFDGMVLTFIYPAFGKNVAFSFIFPLKNICSIEKYQTEAKTSLKYPNVQHKSKSERNILELIFSVKNECDKNTSYENYMLIKYFKNIEVCLHMNSYSEVYVADTDIKISTKLIFETYLKAIFLFSGLQIEKYSSLVIDQVLFLKDIHDVIESTKLVNNFKWRHSLNISYGEFRNTIHQIKLAENFLQNNFRKEKALKKSIDVIKNNHYSSIPLFSTVRNSSFPLRTDNLSDYSHFEETQNNATSESITQESRFKYHSHSFPSMLTHDPSTEHSVESTWKRHSDFSERSNDNKWIFFWNENQNAIEHIWSSDFVSSKEEPKFDSNALKISEIRDINNESNDLDHPNLLFDPDDMQRMHEKEAFFEQLLNSPFPKANSQHLYKPELSFYKNPPFDMELTNQNISETLDAKIYDCENLNSELLETNYVNESIWCPEDVVISGNYAEAAPGYVPPKNADGIILENYEEAPAGYTHPKSDDVIRSLSYESTPADWDPNFYFEEAYPHSAEFENAETTVEMQYSDSDCKTEEASVCGSLFSSSCPDVIVKHHPIYRKPCTFYVQGNCFREDCKYTHDVSDIPCRFWKTGDCFKGSMCPFFHGETGSKEESYKKKTSKKAGKAFKTRYFYSLNSEDDFPALSSTNSETKKTEKSNPINIMPDKSARKKKNRSLNTSV